MTQNEINKCSICQCDFTEESGGSQGHIGIIPVAFCPTCYTGICDMAEQLEDREWIELTDEEVETLIHRFDGDPHTLLDEANARLKERNV